MITDTIIRSIARVPIYNDRFFGGICTASSAQFAYRSDVTFAIIWNDKRKMWNFFVFRNWNIFRELWSFDWLNDVFITLIVPNPIGTACNSNSRRNHLTRFLIRLIMLNFVFSFYLFLSLSLFRFLLSLSFSFS